MSIVNFRTPKKTRSFDMGARKEFLKASNLLFKLQDWHPDEITRKEVEDMDFAVRIGNEEPTPGMVFRIKQLLKEATK